MSPATRLCSVVGVMLMAVLPAHATWSIVMTDVRGNSCVVAVGKDWNHRTPPLLGEIT